MENHPQQLRALYYPYSLCLNSDFLKRALLLFDELVFLGPMHADRALGLWSDYCQALGRHGWHLHSAWGKLAPEYELLLERHVIRFTDTTNLDSSLVVPAWLDDLTDPELDVISGGNSVLGWLVPTARLPRETALWAEIAERTKTNEATLLCGTKLSLEDLRQYVEQSDGSWWGSLHSGLKLDRLPFGVASSLYINQCLLAAELQDLIPVTDSVVHHTMLLRKYERANRTAMSRSSQQPPLSFRPDQTTDVLQKYFILAINVLNTFLSEEELRKRTFSELLAYREGCSEELHRFRVYLNKMLTSLQAEPWTPEFQLQLNRVIQSEVIPEMQKAGDVMKGVYEGLFGGIVKAVVPQSLAMLTPALIASFMAHLSLHQIVATGATALLSGVGLAIPQLTESWKEYKTQRRNALTFLFELSERNGLDVRIRAKRLLLFADESVLHAQPAPDVLFQPQDQRTEPEVCQHVLRYLLTILGSADDARTRCDAASFFEYLANPDDKNLAGRCKWMKELLTMEVDESTLDALISSLNRGDDYVRPVVAMLFGFWKPIRATSALVEYVLREDFDKTGGISAFRWAVSALIRIGGPIVEQCLVLCATERHRDRWQRRDAITGLAILGAKGACRDLLQIAEDQEDNCHVREDAAIAAAFLGDHRVAVELLGKSHVEWVLKSECHYAYSFPNADWLRRFGIVPDEARRPRRQGANA